MDRLQATNEAAPSDSQNYRAYVAFGKQLGEARRVTWNVTLDSHGAAADKQGWDLTALVKGTPPPRHILRDFGVYRKGLRIVNERRGLAGRSLLAQQALSVTWTDLLKAYVCEMLLSKQLKTGSVLLLARALRLIATICCEKDPWEIVIDDFSLAIQLANVIQPSGALAACVRSVATRLFDTHHLSPAGPFSRLLERQQCAKTRRAKFVLNIEELRDSLEERKRSERLPERRAFWELTRIVFTENPSSFSDLIRFAQAKTLILCGLRIGEVVHLPLDWKRRRDYIDAQGRPAGELGGCSSALLLRHFAEKQGTMEGDSALLVESGQYVPEMFRDALTNCLDEVARLTSPLRMILQKQAETGRLLPWFEPDALVPASELYTYLTGNPIRCEFPKGAVAPLFERYRESLDAGIFAALYDLQSGEAGRSLRMSRTFYAYFQRLRQQGLPLRDSSGQLISLACYMRWSETFCRIDEVENLLRATRATKLPDLAAFRLEGGREVMPWELLFLLPKRALVEERADGICDVTRYFAVGRSDAQTLQLALTGGSTTPTLFETYGHTEDDRRLRLLPHSLRHLQNTELFRLGVADTIITKRFNRRSVAQSYEYDHRSLAESLEQIELPDEWIQFLGESKAATVAKMIESGRANGPIVREFRRIRNTEGDEAAFAYLKVEADGFHSTPYGHCLNSFTVDPCPKHLECFNGCRHLSATNLPENREHLGRLEGKLRAALEAAEARPSRSVGRANQVEHARVRLDAVRTLLQTPPGEQAFPNGPDLSLSASTRRETPIDG
jgi:hypothetical protein